MDREGRKKINLHGLGGRAVDPLSIRLTDRCIIVNRIY